MSNATTEHADRVAETITASGTGSLTLNGTAVAGCRTFASLAWGTFKYVNYCISDDLGNWEVGRGNYGSSTLTRNSGNSVVFASSNAGAVVNFPSGQLRVDMILPASYIDKKISFNQAAPTTTKDRANGYFDGMIWVTSDTTSFNPIYYCYDATTGAADWRGVGPVIGRDVTSATLKCYTMNGAGYRWDFTGLNGFNGGAWNGNDANYCAAFGDSANLENAYNLGIGAGKSSGQTKKGGHQAEVVVAKAKTTDATPTDMGDTQGTFQFHENGATVMLVQVVGYSSSGDSFATTFNLIASRATGTPTIVAQTETAVGNSAGAAAWDVSIGTDTYGLTVTVTGAAATTIYWTATAWRTCAHTAV